MLEDITIPDEPESPAGSHYSSKGSQVPQKHEEKNKMAPSMPMQHARDAPKFVPDSDTIEYFFEDYDRKADECEIGHDKRRKQCLRYTDRETAEVWRETEPQPNRAGETKSEWERWKEAVIDLYHQEAEVKYSAKEYRRVVEKFRKEARDAGGWSVEMYQKYSRAVVAFHSQLKKSGRMTDFDAASVFRSAFEGDMARAIERRLELMCPNVRDDDYSMEQTKEAVGFILTKRTRRTEGPSDTTVETVSAPSIPQIKVEGPTESILLRLVDRMDAMMTGQAQLQQALMQMATGTRYTGPQPAQPSFSGPATGQSFQYSGPDNRRCHYCRAEGHLRFRCPDFAQDERAGRCKIVDGRIKLPNGSEPPMAYDKSLRDRIRDYLAEQGASISETTPSNLMFEAVGYSDLADEQVEGEAALMTEGSAFVEEVEEEEGQEVDIVSVLAMQVECLKNIQAALQAGAKGKRMVMESVEVPSLPKRAAGRAKGGVKGKGKDEVVEAGKEVDKGGVAGVEARKETTAGPAYKFRTQIEMDHEGVAKDVAARLLDDTITLKKSELLAIAPDVRKWVRDVTTTKKVPAGTTVGNSATGSLTTFFTNGSGDLPVFGKDDEGRITSTDTLPLRTVKVAINDFGPFEAILDSASSFIAMSRKVWEQMQGGIRDDIRLQMENANAGLSLTLGMMHNAHTTIGGIDFILQIFVVETTAFDVLLGLPFFALATAELAFQLDGTTTLKLVDPNSRQRICLPTQARFRKNREMRGVDF